MAARSFPRPEFLSLGGCRERFDCTCARQPVRESSKPPSWLIEVEAAIRRQIPANELEGMIDNIGLPVSGINLSYNDSGISGPADADILVSLKPNHKPTANYVRNLRLSLNRDFPGQPFTSCRPTSSAKHLTSDFQRRWTFKSSDEMKPSTSRWPIP